VRGLFCRGAYSSARVVQSFTVSMARFLISLGEDVDALALPHFEGNGHF
jgi:hypothetical protein